MSGRFEGKVAFVTGAARGQGRSHVVRLAEEGADIVAIDACTQIEEVAYAGATEEDLKETIRLVEATGRRIIAEVCDVRDLEAMKSVVERGYAEFGRLDVIVANAGIAILTPWHMTTPEIVRTTIDINLIGVWNTVMASVPRMLEAGNGGSIILISSANGVKAGPWTVAYTMSKFGVTGMAKTFAAEFAKDNIRVNSIHPGAVDTPMTQHQIAEGGSDFQKGFEENPNLVAMYTSWIPGQMPPGQITNAVLFLASDEAEWVTGHAMVIDGGVTQY